MVENTESPHRKIFYFGIFALPCLDVVLLHQAQPVDFLLLLRNNSLKCFTHGVMPFLLKQNSFDSGQSFVNDVLWHRFLEAHIPRPPVQ